MSEWHGYFVFENLSLTGAQLSAIGQWLAGLEKENGRLPAHLNHRRTRLDGQAALFEALFEVDDLSVVAFKSGLGDVLTADPATISHRMAGATYGGFLCEEITLAQGEIDAIRVTVLAGLGSEWIDSRRAAVAYLKAKEVQWENGMG